MPELTSVRPRCIRGITDSHHGKGVMTDWTRQRAIEWVTAHRDKRVILRRKGTGLRVEGSFPGVVEVDACSTDYFEAELYTGAPNLVVALSFHEDTVLVHVEGDRPEGGGLCVSLSSSVPYAELLLEEPGPKVAQPSGDDQHEQAEKAEDGPSPYELLH